ncbi:MAG: phytanoyl-CoA dioxygenase family protein [Candidatus Latescibacterota bacterium]|nr:phytanoyl-CoA dioxygenase family protein [Candidatus Latescibacterota bacterium]
MSKPLKLDERLRLPYSIGTGIPKGGDAEIEGYLQSLRVQGFCVVERVIPEDQVSPVRESVHRGRQLLQQDREAERTKRIELECHRNPDSQIGNGPVRPPMASHAELCDIARNETFAEYLVESRVLRVAKAMLDTHVRILQTEVNKSSKPAGKALSKEQLLRRGWHSDWPHDLTAYGPSSEEPWKHCGAIAQPFPDVCMALSTVWYLGPEDVTPHNGGTWVVPGSHKDPRNPRGPDDGIDERAPIPGEFQVAAPAGSVFMQDTRIWHSGVVNQSEHERTAVVCRYAPWWLSGNEFGNLHSGGHTLRTYVPQEVYARFSPKLKLLYRHIAEGEEDVLQPENQHKASRARFVDQPELREPGVGDNSHAVAQAMSIEEWEDSRARNKR